MRGEGPLRYPGAKSNLAPFIWRFIQRHRMVGLPLVEPFGGSGSVSCHLLRRHLIPAATLWELDVGAYSFWHAALHHTEELQKAVENCRVNLEQFDECSATLSEARHHCHDSLKTGFAFLFLNRTSYSGIVGAGPIGGRRQASEYSIDCRFNKVKLITQIDALRQLRENLRVHFGDGIKAIGSASEAAFHYVDPPYFSNGKKFYRQFFTTFDHYRLKKMLCSSPGYWLLSYDYDRKVDYLYRSLPSTMVSLYHSARESGAKREILISPLGFGRLLQQTTAEQAG